MQADNKRPLSMSLAPATESPRPLGLAMCPLPAAGSGPGQNPPLLFGAPSGSHTLEGCGVWEAGLLLLFFPEGSNGPLPPTMASPRTRDGCERNPTEHRAVEPQTGCSWEHHRPVHGPAVMSTLSSLWNKTYHHANLHLGRSCVWQEAGDARQEPGEGQDMKECPHQVRGAAVFRGQKRNSAWDQTCFVWVLASLGSLARCVSLLTTVHSCHLCFLFDKSSGVFVMTC